MPRRERQIPGFMCRRAVARELDVCPRTLMRRLKTDPTFPAPIWEGSAWFWTVESIEKYKADLKLRAG